MAGVRLKRALSCAVAVSSAAAAVLLAPVTSAASCPDVEMIFARGRLEPPGAGIIGNQLVSELRSRVNKNIGLYAVNYPADTQVDIGANDMSQRIQYDLNNCPQTRLVLGGYSLGAAATDMVLALRSEAPYPIVPGQTMGQALIRQPLEHAVNRDAIDVMQSIKLGLHLVMCQRPL